MDEDYYALSKLARTVFGTNDLDHRRDDGRRARGGDDRVARRARTPVTYDDVERAKVILVAGLDAEQEVPILHLRLRKAARRGAKIFVLHPRRTRLHDVAEHILCRPGDEAQDCSVLAAGDGRTSSDGAALREAGADGVVIAGPRLADARDQASGAARARRLEPARGSPTSRRRANDRGALVAGCAPVAPARAAARSASPTSAPRSRPSGGRSSSATKDGTGGASCEACAARDIDVLFLIGVDPLRDYPDAALATRALQNVERAVVQSLELGSLEPYADAFLPAAAFLEKDGHVTDVGGPQPADPADPRRGGHRAARTGRSSRAWRWPPAATWASRRSTSSTRRWARLLAPRERDERAVAGDRAASAADPGEGSLHLFTYPLLVDEGRLSERADELKAALEDERVPGDPPERRGGARRDRRRAVRRCAPRRARRSCRCA